jgi:hypothetical protein
MRTFRLFLLLALAACGSTITTVDGDAKTKDLSPADKNQFCKDVANYVVDSFDSDELARLACGFSVSDSGSSCQADFNECVANAPKVTPIADSANCESFESMLSGCNATVDELSTCIEEMVDALGALEEKAPFCTEDALQSALFGILGEISSECITIFTTCQVSIECESSSGPVDD